MKKLWILLSSFFIIAFFSFFYYDTSDFSGEWEFENDKTVFSMTLTQNGTLVSGNHCSSQFEGSKLDCAIDETDLTTITGTVTEADSVNVTFKSVFCGLTGQATIKRISSTQIKWTITQEPQGEFFIPMNVILTKQ